MSLGVQVGRAITIFDFVSVDIGDVDKSNFEVSGLGPEGKDDTDTSMVFSIIGFRLDLNHGPKL